MAVYPRQTMTAASQIIIPCAHGIHTRRPALCTLSLASAFDAPSVISLAATAARRALTTSLRSSRREACRSVAHRLWLASPSDAFSSGPSSRLPRVTDLPSVGFAAAGGVCLKEAEVEVACFAPLLPSTTNC